MKLLITLSNRAEIIVDKVTFDTGSIDWERREYLGHQDGAAAPTGLYAPHNAGSGRIRYEDVKSIVGFDAYPSMN